jgi:hypothetical protein
VWVFGEIEGLRWVLEQGRMAFPDAAGTRIRTVAAGDRAILYLTRGAFHNPTRDVSHLGGIVRVTSEPRMGKAVTIADRDFVWFVGIEPEIVLPEHQGPEVRLLAATLERVKRPDVWGQYFRTTPIEVSATDFATLESAIRTWAPTQRGTQE